MSKLNTKSTSHRWLTKFVDWIKPEDSTEETIRKQAKEIRERIEPKETADGLVVRSMPWAGSFAKKTGIRRHMRGNHEVEGQDVDLPFVVSPQTKEGEDINSLLEHFARYAEGSYPSTERRRTRSSICLDFKSTMLSYDLVPMLAVEENDEAQVLLRGNGERRLTSVQKHAAFIRTRTDKSNTQDGRVKFNEGVRLVKWWREMRQSQSQVLEDVPSVLLDLLCAKAFDERGVAETYTETLSWWFGYIAHVVRERKQVDFADFTRQAGVAGSGTWAVLDPTNPQNNIVPPWSNLQYQELAEWFDEARDGMARVIAADTVGNDREMLEELVALFGNAIKDDGGTP